MQHQEEVHMDLNPDSQMEQSLQQQQHFLQAQQLQQQHLQILSQFWQDQIQEADQGPIDTKGKNPGLPLARIKKIMKFDEDVKVC